MNNISIKNDLDEKVSIIIVHNDKPGHLNICLQSISVNSLNSNYEVVIVDNGSKTEMAKEFLDGINDCKVIRNQKNLGWTKAANQGVAAADPKSKYLIFLHHDVVILHPAWIDWLINVSESQVSGLIGMALDFYELKDANNKKIKLEFVEDWCMLVTRDCWNDCGPFNEQLEQTGAPFLFTLAAQIKNYNPQVVKNQLVWHFEVNSMDINDMEQESERSMAIMPKLMKEQKLRLMKSS